MSKNERILNEHRICCAICRNGNKLCGPAANFLYTKLNGKAD